MNPPFSKEQTPMKSAKEKRKTYLKDKRRVEVLFSKKDFEVLGLLAKQQGLSLTSLIREATLAQAKNLTLFPAEILDEFKKIQRILRGEATNINQMARIGNTEGSLPENASELILSILQKQEEKIHSLEKFITQHFKA